MKNASYEAFFFMNIAGCSFSCVEKFLILKSEI